MYILSGLGGGRPRDIICYVLYMLFSYLHILQRIEKSPFIYFHLLRCMTVLLGKLILVSDMESCIFGAGKICLEKTFIFIYLSFVPSRV
jgi:hypothetical protein